MAHMESVARRWAELIDRKFEQGLTEAEAAEIACIDLVLDFAYPGLNEMAMRTLLQGIQARLHTAI